MADATPEELAELGVTRTEPPENPEPPRAVFKQTSTLPNEPKTDVRIELGSGEVFRERLVHVPLAIGGTVEDGFNLSISNALLEADGSVARDANGNYQIVPPDARHELRMTGQDMTAMGEAGVKAAIKHAREVAAAKARDYFNGMAIGQAILSSRLH